MGFIHHFNFSYSSHENGLLHVCAHCCHDAYSFHCNLFSYYDDVFFYRTHRYPRRNQTPVDGDGFYSYGGASCSLILYRAYNALFRLAIHAFFVLSYSDGRSHLCFDGMDWNFFFHV